MAGDRTPPSAPSDSTTIVELLADYRAGGFGGDFSITETALIRCSQCGFESAPDEFELHSLRRVEGASDPADMASVLALACPGCGCRGTAIAKYGPEATEAESIVVLAIRDRRGSDELPYGSAPNESGTPTA